MTNEELVTKIQSGKTELMSELWTQVERFVRQQAYKFHETHEARCKSMAIEVDDLIQEGYFAIYNAAEHFNADRGTTFLTYADYHLKKAFFSLAKMNYTGWQNNKIRGCSISLDMQAYADNEEISICDTIADDENLEAAIVNKLYLEKVGPELRRAISELNANWQKVIFAIYYQEIRPVDIAKEKGVARTVISRQHKKALNALKENALLQAYAEKL